MKRKHHKRHQCVPLLVGIGSNWITSDVKWKPDATEYLCDCMGIITLTDWRKHQDGGDYGILRRPTDLLDGIIAYAGKDRCIMAATARLGPVLRFAGVLDAVADGRVELASICLQGSSQFVNFAYQGHVISISDLANYGCGEDIPTEAVTVEDMREFFVEHPEISAAEHQRAILRAMNALTVIHALCEKCGDGS